MPTELIARNLKTYAGKVLKPGQRFHVDDAHVRTLTLAPGKLAVLPDEQTLGTATEPNADAASPDYHTRAMTSGRASRKAQ